MNKKTLLLVLITLVISACSNRQIYENLQKNGQYECRKLPTSAYLKCMEHYAESYEAYTQKREDILK